MPGGVDSEIITRIEERAGRNGERDLAPVILSFDPEYLRYFDRALSEIGHREGPVCASRQSPTSDPVECRSAAIDVILAVYLTAYHQRQLSTLGARVREVSSSPVIAQGLLRRLEHDDNLVTVSCQLSSGLVAGVDAVLRATVLDQNEPDNVALLDGDGLAALRSAVVEAAIVEWLIWREHARSGPRIRQRCSTRLSEGVVEIRRR